MPSLTRTFDTFHYVANTYTINLTFGLRTRPIAPLGKIVEHSSAAYLARWEILGQERQGRHNAGKDFDDLLHNRRHGRGRQPQELANFEKVEVHRQCPIAGESCKKAESVIDLKKFKI